ncbi:MAG: hypothetical protein ABSF48_12380 [Thermodesulfobacteriota bacterium]|jgi:hypothetical protein
MAKILIIAECASLRTFLAEDLAPEGHIVAVTRTPALIGELGISKISIPESFWLLK